MRTSIPSSRGRLVRSAPRAALVAAFLLRSAVALAQPAPVAPLFPVFETVLSADTQEVGSWAVAMAADGRTAIVGVGETRTAARFFDEAGRPQSGVILLELNEPGFYRSQPAAVVGRGDELFVAWRDVRGRRFVARAYRIPNGRPISDVRALSPARDDLGDLELCADPDGGWRAVWTAGREVWLSRSETGEAMLLASEVEDTPSGLALACGTSPGFVVGWLAAGEVRARVFDATGRALSPPRTISREPVPFGVRTAAARLADGSFVVLWWQGEGGQRPLRARFFDPAGRPLTGARALPFAPLDDASMWAFTALANDDGTYQLIWTEPPVEQRETSFVRAYGQVFDAAGHPRDDAFELSRWWTFLGRMGTATDGRGHFAVAWRSPDHGFMAQFFDAAAPGRLDAVTDHLVVGEGDGTVTLPVRRTGGSSGLVSVDYTTVGGRALAGEDFLPSSGTLFLDDGRSGEQPVPLTILSDRRREGTESFVVELSRPTGGAELGPNARVTVEIRDDDVRPLGRGGEPLRASEGWGDAPALVVEPDGGETVAWTDGNALWIRRFDAAGSLRGERVESGHWGPPAVVVDDRGTVAILAQVERTTPLGGRLELVLFRHRPDAGWLLPRGLHLSPPPQGTPDPPQPSLIDVAFSPGFGYAVIGDFDGVGQVLVAGRYDEDFQDSRDWVALAVGRPREGRRRAAVAATAAGAFFLWEREKNLRGWFLPTREEDEAGPPFQVDLGPGEQQMPAVAALPDGRFLALWQSLQGPGERARIVGRLLGADGTPQGGELPISDDRVGDAALPRLAAGPRDVLALWESRRPGSQGGVRSVLGGLLLDLGGRPRGPVLRLGVRGEVSREKPAVAAGPDGDFLASWVEWSQDEPGPVWEHPIVVQGLALPQRPGVRPPPSP